MGRRERGIGTGEGSHKLDKKVIFSWPGITADIGSCCTSSSSRVNQRHSERSLSATTWAGQRSAVQQQLPVSGQYHLIDYYRQDRSLDERDGHLSLSSHFWPH
jgi:hypothetical protein